MNSQNKDFNKYRLFGAYHWAECDRRSYNYNPLLEARCKVLAKRIRDANRILEVGCGDGYLMSLVSPHCDKLVGIDADPLGVKFAKEKLLSFLNCDVMQSNCYHLAFKNGTFDMVLLADVIEHLDRPKDCLKEIKRVLTNTGSLILTTPKWRPDRKWDSRHFKEYKPEELYDLLKPFFNNISTSFFWPLWWHKLYANWLGCHYVRNFSRYFYNPFLNEGPSPFFMVKCWRFAAI
jgi:2-polyprenyl-3-methyl-5-hydroxy-6-metoxy-1,4-benzoquinol methylase